MNSHFSLGRYHDRVFSIRRDFISTRIRELVSRIRELEEHEQILRSLTSKSYNKGKSSLQPKIVAHNKPQDLAFIFMHMVIRGLCMHHRELLSRSENNKCYFG